MNQLFRCLSLTLFLLTSLATFSQNIKPENITIVRDNYGVPYIYSDTDVEAAYALAWVQAEDNFHDIQESMLGVRGLLSSVEGKEGALLDAAAFILDVDGVVNEYYDDTFSPKFKKILGAYAQAMNRYAQLNPKEVRHKNLFPVTEKDIIKGYVMNTAFISNVQFDLARVFENELGAIEPNAPSGSNGIAISPARSADGKTYMVANSHQPLRGFAAWYEVQIETKEGWHFHGATFASGVTPFVGTNKHLGWTHCVNYDDFHDVYRLKMHPTKKNYYEFDGEWLPLEVRKLKLKVKIAGVRVPIARTFYRSKHGTVIKNKSGYYAIRVPANMAIGSAEQWYRMNKATNLEEFNAALEMQEMVNTNITYGDKDGNIMYLGNGLFPYRNPKYDWSKILPGNTSDALWERKFRPLNQLIKYENPACGYVFNMNNTSFDSTCPEENPKPENYKNIGYQTGNTARAYRFHALIDTLEQVSYEDLKRIKHDLTMQFPLRTRGLKNLEAIRHLDPAKYPHIRESIAHLAKWNGSTAVDNQQAALVSLAIQYLIKYLADNHIRETNNTLPEIEYANALHFAQKHLLRHFGKLNIKLGELQKHVRGDKELPIWGVPEVIAQMYTKPYKKGMYKAVLGESFILYATYNEEGLEKVETINCFGTSNHEDSPHYNDQMELFVQQKMKPISMDKAEIMKNAVKQYHPK